MTGYHTFTPNTTTPLPSVGPTSTLFLTVSFSPQGRRRADTPLLTDLSSRSKGVGEGAVEDTVVYRHLGVGPAVFTYTGCPVLSATPKIQVETVAPESNEQTIYSRKTGPLEFI